MRYQIKGSTVTFTNQSVNIGDVTGWKWLLDSGSGFAEVATTLNADITFPATAGVTCTVKLLALGPWGATEVKYEEQFMTVENIPGPVAVPKTIIAQSLSSVDTMMEVQAGTGAGRLTWEIVGGFAEVYGVAVSSEGRVTGIIMTDVNRDIPLKVTDQLGREDFCTLSLSVSSASVYLHAFDLDAGAVVYDPATMKVSGLKNQTGTILFSEPTAANQPIFIPDDGNGKACVEFAEDAHRLAWTFNTQAAQFRGGFCGRIKTTAGTPFSSAFNSSKNIIGSILGYPTNVSLCGYINLNRVSPLSIAARAFVASGYSPATNTGYHGFLSDFDAIVGSNQCVLQPVYGGAGNSALRFNGVRVSVPPAGSAATFADFVFHGSVAVHVAGMVLGAKPASGFGGETYFSERFRLYSFAVWLTATNSGISPAHLSAETVNDVTQYYSRKYGIPCKKITSLTA